MAIEMLESLGEVFAEQLRFAVDVFSDLWGIYSSLEPEGHHQVPGSIFPKSGSIGMGVLEPARKAT